MKEYLISLIILILLILFILFFKKKEFFIIYENIVKLSNDDPEYIKPVSKCNEICKSNDPPDSENTYNANTCKFEHHEKKCNRSSVLNSDTLYSIDKKCKFERDSDKCMAITKCNQLSPEECKNYTNCYIDESNSCNDKNINHMSVNFNTLYTKEECEDYGGFYNKHTLKCYKNINNYCKEQDESILIKNNKLGENTFDSKKCIKLGKCNTNKVEHTVFCNKFHNNEQSCNNNKSFGCNFEPDENRYVPKHSICEKYNTVDETNHDNKAEITLYNINKCNSNSLCNWVYPLGEKDGKNEDGIYTGKCLLDDNLCEGLDKITCESNGNYFCNYDDSTDKCELNKIVINKNYNENNDPYLNNEPHKINTKNYCDKFNDTIDYKDNFCPNYCKSIYSCKEIAKELPTTTPVVPTYQAEISEKVFDYLDDEYKQINTNFNLNFDINKSKLDTDRPLQNYKDEDVINNSTTNVYIKNENRIDVINKMGDKFKNPSGDLSIYSIKGLNYLNENNSDIITNPELKKIVEDIY